MSDQGQSPEEDFRIVSDAEFERMSFEERIAYLKNAIDAMSRLRLQIVRTLGEQHP